LAKELKELREKTSDELRERLDELWAELRDVRTKIATGGAVAKPSQARNLRKTIARIKTVLRERELGINV